MWNSLTAEKDRLTDNLSFLSECIHNDYYSVMWNDTIPLITVSHCLLLGFTSWGGNLTRLKSLATSRSKRVQGIHNYIIKQRDTAVQDSKYVVSILTSNWSYSSWQSAAMGYMSVITVFTKRNTKTRLSKVIKGLRQITKLYKNDNRFEEERIYVTASLVPASFPDLRHLGRKQHNPHHPHPHPRLTYLAPPVS